MLQPDYADAALVLVGHGSTRNAESGATVYQHAAELRRRGLFAAVREAFVRQEPQGAAVVSQLTTPRVFVVPLFISEGYFTEQFIPRELGLRTDGATGFDRMQSRGSQTVFYCGPIGTHPRMTSVLLARARDIVRDHPFPCAPPPQDISLFLAGHGTPKDQNSRQAVEAQAELIRRRGLYADVQAVFLEEEPRIADCYRLARTRNVVLVPFFTSDGLHVREDIPALLGEPDAVIRQRLDQQLAPWRNPTERQGRRLWYTASIGSEPGLADVILERVREAAAKGFQMKGMSESQFPAAVAPASG